MLAKNFPDFATFATAAGEPALRWGIAATGRIAGRFTAAIREHSIQRPVAVGSRSAARAREFADLHGIERSFGSYEQLVEDPGIDVIYVAAPQSEHLRIGLLAINAGKHVLIEKPLATNSDDARTLVAAAREAKVFLMEGMWSRYLPQAALTRAVLAEGILGEIRGVVADHGQAVPVDAGHRLYRSDLGGGALFDLGIYPVQLDSMVLGRPTAVTSMGGMTTTGVDSYSTVVLEHGVDRQSTLTTSLLAKTPTTASIIGSAGRLDFGSPFYIPTRVSLADSGHGTPQLRWDDTSGRVLMDALSWEATALATYVGEGLLESPLHPLHETVSIIETLEEAVAQIRRRAPAASSAADHV